MTQEEQEEVRFLAGPLQSWVAAGERKTQLPLAAISHFFDANPFEGEFRMLPKEFRLETRVGRAVLLELASQLADRKGEGLGTPKRACKVPLLLQTGEGI